MLTMSRDVLLYTFAIIIGTVVGLISVGLCIYFKLAIWGFNIYLIISPMIAGFVETYISKILLKKTTGAISAIILFVVTNVLSWFFPVNPINWNIFTIGGIFVMLQAAFPLTINFIIFAFLLFISYILGLVGKHFGAIFYRRVNIEPNMINLGLEDSYDVLILNNTPEMHIKEYVGLIYAEEVIDFNKKNLNEKLEYFGSGVDKRKSFKAKDYQVSREYIIHKLQEEALNSGANAVIDIEIEYTNCNGEMPPDVLVAAYGTAVILDKKYIPN